MLYFVTGNTYKVNAARIVLDPFGITFEVINLPLIEIQSSNSEEIAVHKAKQAYELLKEPIIIKDDSWHIDALHGFPGPYMKYVNEWFRVADYQNLLRTKRNKKVIFTETLCYHDNQLTKTFKGDSVGRILETPKGTASHPFMRLVTFRKDGLTMAEASNRNLLEFEESSAWKLFAAWYKAEVM